MDTRRYAVDEADGLLADNLELEPKSNTRNWPSTIAQIVFGSVGIGAGVLYLGPAQTCSITQDCGKWLSAVTSEKAAIIIFTAGGLDFSAGAMFMGAQSADATVNYINAQSSLAAKIGKGSLVVLVAAVQSVPLLLTSLKTTPVLWQTILTVGGNLPGSLFGAVNLIQTEIPYLMSKAGVLASNFHHQIVDSCLYSSEADKQEWAMISHYRKQHAHFLENTNARWKALVANAQTLKADDVKGKHALSFLYEQEGVTPDHSWLASGVHAFGSLSGFLLALNITAGGASNTLNVLKRFIPTLPLQVLSTALVTSAHLYGNIKLTIDGVTSFLDPLVDIIRGKPIDSSVFQLRPKTSLLIGGLSVAFSALSYAVIAVLFINEFSDTNNQTQSNFSGDNNATELDGVRKGFLFSAMAGIDIYHFASLFHLYRLLFTALTRDQKEKFILTLEHEVARLNKMTESEFITFVKSNDMETNQLLGLDTYRPPSDIENVSINSTQDNESAPILRAENVEKQQSPSSWFGKWCSWYSTSSSSDDDTPQPESYSAYSPKQS